MRKVSIIHGWGGGAEGGFLPWLKRELEKNGYQVEVPLMPSSSIPVVGEWVEKINQTVGTPDEDTILVGYSLGGLAILKYIESIPDNIKIDKLVLVASVIDSIKNLSEEEGHIARPWLEAPLNSDKIRHSSDKIIAFFSANDPLIPLSGSEFVKNELKGKVIIENDMGHYDLREVPGVLKAIVD
jgi:uncharacterized protein